MRERTEASSIKGMVSELYRLSQEVKFNQELKEKADKIEWVKTKIIELVKKIIELSYPGQDIFSTLPGAPVNKQDELARGGIVHHTDEIVRVSIPYCLDKNERKRQDDPVPGVEKRWGQDELDIYFEKGKGDVGEIIVEIPLQNLAAK